MTDPLKRVLDQLYQVTGQEPKPSGTGWMSRCPAHDDRCPSLKIDAGDDGRALLACHAGCSLEAICAALGLAPRDLFRPSTSTVFAKTREKPYYRRRRQNQRGDGAKEIYPTCQAAVTELERRHGKRSESWTYEDIQGQPVGAILRWDGPGGKDIRPVTRNSEGWVIEGMPDPRPLYRLTELAGADHVFVCEGEKSAEAARSIGLIATTSAHGSKSAEKTDWAPLAGKQVLVLPDNDQAGEGYKDAVVAILARLKPAPTVKVVRLPGLPDGGDIADWLDERDAHVCVPRASVSICGGIQPNTLTSALGRKHLDNGLAARLLFTMPSRMPKKWTDADIGPEVEAQFASILDRLLELRGEAAGAAR